MSSITVFSILLKKDLPRTLSRTISVFSSSVALFGKLKKERSSQREIVIYQSNVSDGDNSIGVLNWLKSSYSQAQGVWKPISVPKNDVSSTKEEIEMDEDEDVWVEIFKRLPMESVCRFRCVCKKWNSIISSAFFINLHFTFTLSATPCNLKPYLHIGHQHCSLHRPLEGDKQQLYLHFPFNKDVRMLSFVDVIHGVVCMTYSKSYKIDSFDWTFLWNPSIRKYVTLPHLELDYDQFTTMGFGYDASKNDFKVITFSNTFNVYSVREGRWRPPLARTPNKLISHMLSMSKGECRHGCFLNGTIYWLVRKRGSASYSIVMFDCVSEEARIMDMPKQGPWSECYFVFFKYAGMLAIMGIPFRSGIKIWVLEDDGAPTSWKKLYTLNADPINIANCEIIIADPSFEIEKRASYGPSNKWEQRRQIYSNHVYNKSMFLMDHPKAQSYTRQSQTFWSSI